MAAGMAAALLATPAAEAAPRESRPGLSWPSQLRLPWSTSSKSRAAPRRARKPSPRAAKPAATKPRPSPERNLSRPPPDERAAAPGERRSKPAAAPAAATAPVPAPAPAAPASDDAGASAARAADFAAVRVPVPTPPLSPLPTGEPPLPDGPVADVPLPPARDPQPVAEPERHAALVPKAPLDGPPLPGPPDADTPPPVVAPPPGARAEDPDCRALDADGGAVAEPLPPILGPGSCGAPLPVSLSGVKRKDGSVMAIRPAATLRCGMALAVVEFVRDGLDPAAQTAGLRLTEVLTASSYVCRGRNGRAGAKMSEHGLANALDVSGYAFADGRTLDVYDKDLPEGFEATTKSAACGDFATVLGPGSDGLHEEHLHLDLRRRRSASSVLCQWDED